jgi:EAL domain-containing protein (putative c-di-GMP-specific phosphodiesterase class I)
MEDEKRIIMDSMLSDKVLESLEQVERDLKEKPLMLLVVKGFFKDEEWIDYLARVLDTREMIKDFGKMLEERFNVVKVVKVEPFNLAVIVDFKSPQSPNKQEILDIMENLESDVINFLLGPKYLGEIKEQVDIFTSPFKNFMDFSIGHSFIREKSREGLEISLRIALKDAEARKSHKIAEYTEELLTILDRKSLETHFQPIVDLREKKVYAYEALVRGPKGSKLRNPDLLFKMAVLNGLEIVLDRISRRIHIENFKKLSKSSKVYLNINLGPFEPMFIDEADRDIKKAGIPPERIVWEVSEKAYVDDFPAFLRSLDYIIRLGYKIDVDNLGSGATSFKLACSMKPNVIKIDRDLVRDVDKMDDKKNILYKMIQGFYNAGIVIVAEGVETLKELNTLIKLGFRHFQGFYLFKPSPNFISEKEVNSKLRDIDTSVTKIFTLFYDF